MYCTYIVRELGAWVASAKGPLLERMQGKMKKKKKKKKKFMQEQEDSKLVQNEGAGLLKFYFFFLLYYVGFSPTPGFLISLNISLQLKSKAVGDSPFLIFFSFFFPSIFINQSTLSDFIQ